MRNGSAGTTGPLTDRVERALAADRESRISAPLTLRLRIPARLRAWRTAALPPLRKEAARHP
ncbi:hypothetical protein [Streptomyces sp. NPDC089919]|uniref:hypothetical protein n=1 Tax=Streptomyces sp. NPDC089919 TaxID=3155188 RepID=UPI0034166B76